MTAKSPHRDATDLDSSKSTKHSSHLYSTQRFGGYEYTSEFDMPSDYSSGYDQPESSFRHGMTRGEEPQFNEFSEFNDSYEWHTRSPRRGYNTNHLTPTSRHSAGPKEPVSKPRSHQEFFLPDDELNLDWLPQTPPGPHGGADLQLAVPREFPKISSRGNEFTQRTQREPREQWEQREQPAHEPEADSMEEQPVEVLRVMQAYGPGTWVHTVHIGWNGGVDSYGVVRNLFRQKLHEEGYHFVPYKFSCYIKVPVNMDVDHIDEQMEEIAQAMNAERAQRSTQNKGGLSRGERRNGRARIKVRTPPIHVTVPVLAPVLDAA